MSRSHYLLSALLLCGIVAVALVLVMKADDAQRSVNSEDIASADPSDSASGSPLEDLRDVKERKPDDPTPVPLPGGSPGDEHVVTGSVTATTGTLPATLPVIATPETGEPQVVQTEDGRFRFEFDHAGAVTLTADADSWYQLEPVTVTVPSAATIELAPAALLNGRVSCSNGSILANTRVELTAGGNIVADTETDAGGHFGFRRLRPGAYRIEVVYGDNHVAESLFIVVGDNTQDVIIDSGTELTVRLLDEYGTAVPLAGAEPVALSVYHSEWPVPSSAVSGSVGRPGEVLWRGLRTARYVVQIRIPGFEQTFVNLDVSGDHLEKEVTLKRGGAIAGVVQVVGELPPQLMEIRLSQDNSTYLAGLDENNRFAVESLPLGKYTVEVIDTTSNLPVASETVEVTGGTANVSLRVEAGATLTLEFVADGVVVTEVSVWVQLSNNDGARHWAQSEGGKVAMGFLKPGEYSVDAMVLEGGFAGVKTGITISGGNNVKQITLQKPNCLKVVFVLKGSNADDAGLKEGDLLLEFNGAAANSVQVVKDAVGKLKEGDTATMRVVRNDEELELRIENWKGPQLGLSTEDAYHE